MSLKDLFIISFKLLDAVIIRKQALKNNGHTCISKHSKKMQLFILNLIQGFQPFPTQPKHLNIF